MSLNNKFRFGIIGGMGTAAGLLFQKMFFELCHSKGIKSDQDYPEWIYYNASKAPDRTAAIIGESNSPVEYLTEVIRKLDEANADVIIVACNTAHAFYDEINQHVKLPWVHLQNETARRLKHDEVETAGILATEGTIRAGLFSKAFSKLGITAVEPSHDSDIQKKISSAIYEKSFGIKNTGSRISEESVNLLQEVLMEMNVNTVVAGCTELSFAFSQMDLKLKYYDPMKIAAEILYDLWIGKRAIDSL